MQTLMFEIRRKNKINQKVRLSFIEYEGVPLISLQKIMFKCVQINFNIYQSKSKVMIYFSLFN